MPPTETCLPRLLVIVGPTAVGKTAFALALAEYLDGEIISADSRYLYRGLDIGTAKPSPAEQARVPHHLIDVTSPDHPWTLAEFKSAAEAAICASLARRHWPLLVGGTGQYIRAITEGWEIPPGAPASAVRAELESELKLNGVAALAKRLQAVDAASAACIDLQNPRRVVRALEVALTTGTSFVTQRRKSPPPYACLSVGLTRPRPDLYARIDARVEAMLHNGLVAEVQALVAQGYSWELPAMSALGYKQVGQYLRGECSLAEAVQQIKRATRVFVRRQANWFKPSDPQIHWFEAEHLTAPIVCAQLALQRLAS